MSELTAMQLRAARAMLRMEQTDLARRAQVSVETVKRLEGQTGALKATGATIAGLRRVLELYGIEFLDPGAAGGVGVRMALRPDKRLREEISAAVAGMADAMLEIEFRRRSGRWNATGGKTIDDVVEEVAATIEKSLSFTLRRELTRLLPDAIADDQKRTATKRELSKKATARQRDEPGE